MNKTINVIHFWPGHAGHFIGFLLSLDQRTYPIHNPKDDIATITSRKDYYSFKNLIWKYGSWRNFHIAFLQDLNLGRTEFKRIDNFLNSDFDTYTTLATPQHFKSYFPVLKEKYLDKNLKVNYLTIHLSKHLDWVVDEFCKNNNNFPNPPGHIFPKDFHECFDDYQKTYNPYVINLDNIFYGLSSFLDEYTKLNNHIGLPLHIEDATEYYKDWYTARKMHTLQIQNPNKS